VRIQRTRSRRPPRSVPRAPRSAGDPHREGRRVMITLLKASPGTSRPARSSPSRTVPSRFCLNFSSINERACPCLNETLEAKAGEQAGHLGRTSCINRVFVNSTKPCRGSADEMLIQCVNAAVPHVADPASCPPRRASSAARNRTATDLQQVASSAPTRRRSNAGHPSTALRLSRLAKCLASIPAWHGENDDVSLPNNRAAGSGDVHRAALSVSSGALDRCCVRPSKRDRHPAGPGTW